MQILTHTSNVGEIPFEPSNSNNNRYSGYLKADVLNYTETIKIPIQKSWEYSNLGFALAGIYLEDVFEAAYSEIIDTYIKTDMPFDMGLAWMIKKELSFYPIILVRGMGYKIHLIK